MMCGIGSYTSYLLSKMPAENWRVTSFELTEFPTTEYIGRLNDRVSFKISPSYLHLPPSLEGEVIWFEHAFGVWGKEPAAFVQLVKTAKERRKKVIASFHTIHFESYETDSGMRRIEENLMNEVLPLLDAATVFTDGAYKALNKAFPQYENKIVTLRHGVHLHPKVSQEEAKTKLLRYLVNKENSSPFQKQELKVMYLQLFSPETILLGNFGFINREKDPLELYELGSLVQARFPKRRIIVLYVGKIPKTKGQEMEENLPILENLRSIHDGRRNLLFNDYLPEDILPYAFGAMDFSIFWCRNGTQSGRMAHAQGTGTCVVGRKIEGIGETLDIARLPSAVSLEDLSEKIGRLILEPALGKQAETLSGRYAQEYSFERQAKKHLLLGNVVQSSGKLPVLDGNQSR